MVRYIGGRKIIAEGKTKWILEDPDNQMCVEVRAKDDITAGDGAKHDILVGKGALATKTAENVFKLLRRRGMPVAYLDGIDEIAFRALRCNMLPYEVIIRAWAAADGSYRKRHPHIQKDAALPDYPCEFYLKTKDRLWKGYRLVTDDPLMAFVNGQIHLYNPKTPASEAKPFLTLDTDEVFTQDDELILINRMEQIAREVFMILEQAWARVGGKLVDFKIELGIAPDGTLVIADVIDNDSWRVVMNGEYIDKQVYRNGGDLADVLHLYQLVAELTSRPEFHKAA